MMTIGLNDMRGFLAASISSLNRNKLNGLLAEIDLRRFLLSEGFGHRVSAGGWIARSTGAGHFAHQTFVAFPLAVAPGSDLDPGRQLPMPPLGLHTICATFRQLGIESYFCVPSLATDAEVRDMTWKAKALGIPWDEPYCDFPGEHAGFECRERRYNFLRNQTDTSMIADEYVAEEFSKEHLRVSLSNRYLAEISDLDGVFWGQQYTYPLEIKEKTCARDPRLGEYFGLDLGPFVKLAYYAAKRGNLHSLFIVREIADPESRELVAWRYITFDRLAQFASWIQQSGGQGMSGGSSAVVRIPKSEFSVLDREALSRL